LSPENVVVEAAQLGKLWVLEPRLNEGQKKLGCSDDTDSLVLYEMMKWPAVLLPMMTVVVVAVAVAAPVPLKLVLLTTPAQELQWEWELELNLEMLCA
jgi:hypothetical protein